MSIKRRNLGDSGRATKLCRHDGGRLPCASSRKLHGGSGTPPPVFHVMRGRSRGVAAIDRHPGFDGLRFSNSTLRSTARSRTTGNFETARA